MSKQKGHNFERKMAKVLRESLGHNNTRSTRSSSRRLDACGIDLIGTNFLYQCKSGYANRRPRFEEEYLYIKDNLLKSFPPEHKIHRYPIALAYEIDVGKGNKRADCHTQITMSLNDFLAIMRHHQEEILDII